MLADQTPVKIIETPLYKFDQLDTDTQQKVLDKLRYSNLDHDWWEFQYEFLDIIGNMLGLTITNKSFSGFCSQGDGASFSGEYEYKKGALKAIKEYVPNETELHDIAKRLQDVQKPNFYKVHSIITQRGRYCHENTMYFDTANRDIYGGEIDTSQETNDTIEECMRDLARWFYRNLEREHDCIISDESTKEVIACNEWLFDETGSIQ